MRASAVSWLAHFYIPSDVIEEEEWLHPRCEGQTAVFQNLTSKLTQIPSPHPGCTFNSPQVRGSDSRHLHLRLTQPIPPPLTERHQVPLQHKSKFLKPKLGYGLIWDGGKIYFTAAFFEHR